MRVLFLLLRQEWWSLKLRAQLRHADCWFFSLFSKTSIKSPFWKAVGANRFATGLASEQKVESFSIVRHRALTFAQDFRRSPFGPAEGKPKVLDRRPSVGPGIV